MIQQARQRAYLRGIDIEITPADILGFDPDEDLLADTIILEPPFGLKYDRADLADPRWAFGMPPTSSADLLWVQHAVAHLNRGGRAYVVTPTSAKVTSSAVKPGAAALAARARADTSMITGMSRLRLSRSPSGTTKKAPRA